ncbi:hypothetical protein BV898_08285 [Hypsibius exemplaris]|uniref:Uncharacterized protein n=1 Tax=Hypsibius exemplaris TaxID=2072580 RepID=A0A1W0WR50_HYPEX|nr:hypothetical protein BV898_08285 [Hypsibius exemplaris]
MGDINQTDYDGRGPQQIGLPLSSPTTVAPKTKHLERQKSILRNSGGSSSHSCQTTSSGCSRTEMADHCRSSHKGVRFSDGSSPGRQNTPEDERRKVACYEPSPQAIANHQQLDIPEESWADMLRKASDIDSLKQLLDQTRLHTDSINDFTAEQS